MTHQGPGNPTAHEGALGLEAPGQAGAQTEAQANPAADSPRTAPAVFTQGSILRHVVVMTATGSVGLVAIFAVDLLNLFYLSLLGQQELAAAVGYAGTILFALTSISIGMTIGITALTSRRLGAGDRERARQIAASGLSAAAALLSLVSAGAFLAGPDLLALLGARGTTHELASRFLHLTLPSTVFLALGMAASGLLRAVGDASRAMWVTLWGGIVAAIADPILIFALGLGLDGAAIASNLSRAAIMVAGLYGVLRVHDLVGRPSWSGFARDVGALGGIAGPAILTNLATPFATAYLTAELARYGDAAVAGWAIILRLVPVAFGALFALSGSVGPIFGQNYGARRFDRMHRVLMDSLLLSAAYVAVIWLVLLAGQEALIALFRAEGPAGEFLRFFLWVSVLWLFNGALFVANAAFNTLGAPILATLFNWGRATLGTIPFAMAGAALGGAEGIMLGQLLGGVVFGVAAAFAAHRFIARLASRPAEGH